MQALERSGSLSSDGSGASAPATPAVPQLGSFASSGKLAGVGLARTGSVKALANAFDGARSPPTSPPMNGTGSGPARWTPSHRSSASLDVRPREPLAPSANIGTGSSMAAAYRAAPPVSSTYASGLYSVDPLPPSPAPVTHHISAMEHLARSGTHRKTHTLSSLDSFLNPNPYAQQRAGLTTPSLAPASYLADSRTSSSYGENNASLSRASSSYGYDTASGRYDSASLARTGSYGGATSASASPTSVSFPSQPAPRIGHGSRYDLNRVSEGLEDDAMAPVPAPYTSPPTSRHAFAHSSTATASPPTAYTRSPPTAYTPAYTSQPTSSPMLTDFRAREGVRHGSSPPLFAPTPRSPAAVRSPTLSTLSTALERTTSFGASAFVMSLRDAPRHRAGLVIRMR